MATIFFAIWNTKNIKNAFALLAKCPKHYKVFIKIVATLVFVLETFILLYFGIYLEMLNFNIFYWDVLNCMFNLYCSYFLHNKINFKLSFIKCTNCFQFSLNYKFVFINFYQKWLINITIYIWYFLLMYQ